LSFNRTSGGQTATFVTAPGENIIATEGLISVEAVFRRLWDDRARHRSREQVAHRPLYDADLSARHVLSAPG